MTVHAAVVGGSGYTGVELLRLLAAHPEIVPVRVTAHSHAGERAADVYPSLAAAYPDLVFAPNDVEALRGLDLVLLLQPHGESQRTIPDLVDHVGHIVDLGADFRLPTAGLYEQWYGEVHTAPELLGRFAYGMPELFRADILAADHVAAPGCYPTAAALALAPLLAAGMVEPTGIVVDAYSGVSGAGRAAKTTSLFAEVDESLSAYGLLTHRHTAEMELALSRAAGGPAQVLFTPHLAPLTRGILATGYARPATAGLTTESLLAHYRTFYAEEPFVVVGDAPPSTKSTLGANTVHVTVRFDERTNTVVALGAIDNLTKGASGQMLQCANLLLGLPETTGLPTIGMMP